MKRKFLAAIIVIIIIAQLIAGGALTQAKADCLPASPQSSNWQSQTGGTNINTCLQGCWNCFVDFCKFCGWWNNQHPSTIAYIVVSPKTATIAAGQSQTYTATAYNQFGNSWVVSNSPNTVWSIDSGAGTYTWTGSSVQVTEAGNWTVTATYRCKSDTACLTVTHAGLDKLSYITASVNPTTVAAPNTVTGTATAYDIYGNSWDVSTLATWSIPAGGDGGSWAQNVYTSHTAGTYTVQAAYGGKTASASLTVTHSTEESNLASLSISPSSSTIAAGSTQSYTATATDTFGNSWDVTAAISASNGWSISSGAGGSWTAATYTSEKAGEWTVTGVYLDKSATSALTVTHATSVAYLDYITASLSPTTVAAPNTVTGTATAYDTFGNSWDISTLATWSIPAGGDGGSWSQNIYTSHTAGNYTVQAAYEGKTATAQLTVTHSTNPAYLDYISISPKTATVNAGVSQSYTTTAYDTFGNSWTVTAVYTCPSSNAVISGNSVYSNTDGTYTITGTYSGLSDTATLTVIGHLATIVSITVSPQTATVSAGLSQAFTATASDGYNTWNVTDQVTWSINATAGGSWSQSTGTYTSATAGVWTVQAAMSGVSGTATLTVNANSALLSYIVISPKTATVAAGTPQSYTVTAYGELGNSLGDVTSSTTFSAPGASVTGNSVTASTGGSYKVTATYEGLTDTATLTVTGSTSPPSYTVTFTENGLQSGTSWSITFGGQTYTSATNSIVINNLSAQSYSWNTSNIIQLGSTQFLTTQTSGALSVPTQLTQNIDYSTQYLVTFSAMGNVLSVTVPANEWVISGGQATGTFPAQVIDDTSDTRCNFISDNRPANITQPTTIVGTYQTQYYLTVTSPYGNPNGGGWYNSGALATVSLSNADVSGGSGMQYAFQNWSGTASGTALTLSVSMTAPETVAASWSTQYLVTYAATGNVLSITVPANEWVTAGSSAQGQFVSAVANSADNTRCLFLSDNRPQSITEPTTITAQYQTQYTVTFGQIGIGSDAKGTILTISGNPKDYSQLANVTWVDNGAQLTFSFKATVPSTAANKLYSLTNVNATSPIVINSPTSIQGSYKTIHSAVLYTVLEFALLIFAILIAAFSAVRYQRNRQKKLRNASEAANPSR